MYNVATHFGKLRGRYPPIRSNASCEGIEQLATLDRVLADKSAPVVLGEAEEMNQGSQAGLHRQNKEREVLSVIVQQRNSESDKRGQVAGGESRLTNQARNGQELSAREAWPDPCWVE